MILYHIVCVWLQFTHFYYCMLSNYVIHNYLFIQHTDDSHLFLTDNNTSMNIIVDVFYCTYKCISLLYVLRSSTHMVTEIYLSLVWNLKVLQNSCNSFSLLSVICESPICSTSFEIFGLLCICFYPLWLLLSAV